MIFGFVIYGNAEPKLFLLSLIFIARAGEWKGNESSRVETALSCGEKFE